MISADKLDQGKVPQYVELHLWSKLFDTQIICQQNLGGNWNSHLLKEETERKYLLRIDQTELRRKEMQQMLLQLDTEEQIQ